MKNLVNWLNDALAEKVTAGVSTMWCAYLFLALAIYGFPFHNLTSQSFIQWLSQECIQLVMLSVLAVGQAIQSRKLTDQGKQIADLHAKHDALHLHLGIHRSKNDEARTPDAGGSGNP